MSTHSWQGGADDGTALPAALPLSLRDPSRLSWELGARVVADDGTELHSEWESPDVPWALSVFSVTTNTVLLRVRTPVGRKRFYGTTRSALRSVIPSLETAPGWRRVE